MLTRVQISNINAIENADIDFQKGKYKYLDKMIYQDKLVNPIAFYGSNGSGKSSFLNAMLHLLNLMFFEPQKQAPFQPNRFIVANRLNEIKERQDATDDMLHSALTSIKSSIKMFFEINKNEYQYFIETSLKGCITREYLIANEQQIFERNESSYKIGQNISQIVESLYPTLRKLSIDHQENEHINTAFSFLSGMGYIDAEERAYCFRDMVERNHLDLIVEKSSLVKDILSQYHEFPSYDFVSRTTQDGEKEYQIKLYTDSGYIIMPYKLMSGGMLNQSVLLSTLLSLPENSVLFVDEIEDALHPITILDFIKVAQQKNIQLIFSSHNTYLLQKLRPDQIIFANWKNGCSTYKKLSDIYPNIREINNIEKMYFSNMFDEDIKNG